MNASFQPKEGPPSRGLLRDCKIFANLRLQLYWAGLGWRGQVQHRYEDGPGTTAALAPPRPRVGRRGPSAAADWPGSAAPPPPGARSGRTILAVVAGVSSPGLILSEGTKLGLGWQQHRPRHPTSNECLVSASSVDRVDTGADTADSADSGSQDSGWSE